MSGGWRTLQARADTDARIDAGRLDELIAWASRQVEELEELRVRAASRVLTQRRALVQRAFWLSGWRAGATR